LKYGKDPEGAFREKNFFFQKTLIFLAFEANSFLISTRTQIMNCTVFPFSAHCD